MGESPVERGLARAHLHALARGVYSLQFPPVVGIIRFLPPFKPSPKLLNSIEDARVSNMSAFETNERLQDPWRDKAEWTRWRPQYGGPHPSRQSAIIKQMLEPALLGLAQRQRGSGGRSPAIGNNDDK
jgi:hypothetical protein